MKRAYLFATILAAAVCATTALAQAITIEEPYARASSALAKSGAAFMTIVNASATDDRLIAASSTAAARVEIHTHIEDSNGVMRMMEVKDGIPVPAGGKAMLMRGGDHVMFIGLTGPFVDGEAVDVTLTFEQAGDVAVQIPVDLNRAPGVHGGHATH